MPLRVVCALAFACAAFAFVPDPDCPIYDCPGEDDCDDGLIPGDWTDADGCFVCGCVAGGGELTYDRARCAPETQPSCMPDDTDFFDHLPHDDHCDSACCDQVDALLVNCDPGSVDVLYTYIGCMETHLPEGIYDCPAFEGAIDSSCRGTDPFPECVDNVEFGDESEVGCSDIDAIAEACSSEEEALQVQSALECLVADMDLETMHLVALADECD